MTSEQKLIAGVDIGGTKLAVGVADTQGRLLEESRQLSDVHRGPDAVIEDIIQMVRDTVRKVGARPENLCFLGVASPGPLSQKRGVILMAPNMPGWEDYPLIARLREGLQCPAVLENDANAAGLGEALFGAGAGHRFVAYFTVSTGVGGGFVQDGRILHGADGNAAEFGHQIIVPIDGDVCPCGQPGHLEAYASGTSIARRARTALAGGEKSMLTDMAASLDDINTRLIAEAARAGDALSQRLWEETGFYLGIGVVNVIQSFNPEVVVLGGGVTHVDDLLFDPLRRTVEERVMKEYKGSFRIEKARLADKVGIMGAIGLARVEGLM